jgi:LmbE family N-acetylglucosaminyl deacetylase
MTRLLPVLTFFLFVLGAGAQAPVSMTSAEMYQGLRKLNVLGSVLYVAAHPDDENTRLISYLSKDRLYRTGYLSMTRGDGGQNLIGEEQGIELGLIRTQELLAARRIDGGEQFFTRAYDFGFSKNPEETFDKWNREKILADVVWVIRKFQPDVIITRFPTTGEGGHGHHTASAILANDAFTAAADPNRFPEQLQYVKPWQAKRVLWNAFNFGGNNTTRDNQFKFDVGGYNPLLGKSYGEISSESRSQHKSQGFGVPAGRGEALEYFQATKGEQPKTDLMEGVDMSWNRVPGGAVISRLIDSLVAGFDFFHPERSVPGLLKIYQSMNRLPDSEWKSKKLTEVITLIEQCSGLFIDVTSTSQFAVQTDSIRFNFSFNNRLGNPVVIRRVTVGTDFDSTLTQVLSTNRNVNFSKTVYVPVSKNITQPYWLEEKMAEGYYNVKDPLKTGIPDVDPSYQAVIVASFDGMDIPLVKTVRYRFTDPVRGELYEPLVVIPPVLVSVDEKVKLALDKDDIKGSVQLQGRKNNVSGKVEVGGPGQAKDFKMNTERFVLPERNVVTDLGYVIRPGEETEYRVTVSVANTLFSKSLNEVKYDHVPYIHYFTDATVQVRNIDLKTSGKKIAYIPGAGDKVLEALEQMGYEVNRLTEKELSRNDLQKFDAIITGVRAYNTNDWLNKHYDKLMKYVEEGGNLIVQYNTSNQIGPVRAKIGPYNFNISRTRVTDENAAVNILKPEHPVFNFPNKITQDDFRNWIQERSIYHAGGWDSTKFETLISMNDPGEKPDQGSLIIAKHGKGYFTYTGLVFFRQLPAGVEGAYRLLANLIALNRKKGF